MWWPGVFCVIKTQATDGNLPCLRPREAAVCPEPATGSHDGNTTSLAVCLAWINRFFAFVGGGNRAWIVHSLQIDPKTKCRYEAENFLQTRPESLRKSRCDVKWVHDFPVSLVSRCLPGCPLNLFALSSLLEVVLCSVEERGQLELAKQNLKNNKKKIKKRVHLLRKYARIIMCVRRCSCSPAWKLQVKLGFLCYDKKNLSLINHKYSSFVEGEKTLSGSMLLVCDWCSSFLELWSTYWLQVMLK